MTTELNYYNHENLFNLFYNARIAHTLNDCEKRELRRALELIQPRNSQTLFDAWHHVYVNAGCTTFGTICRSITRAEARQYAERVFEWATLKTIHTRKVGAGIAIRVDVYNEEVFA